MDEQHTSFGSKLAGLGRAALQETQRNTHMASLKAQIEKLKLVDVHKAQYALGRKAYELRIAPERFGGEYEEIAAIESSITEKRAGVPSDHTTTNIQLMKGAAVSVKMKAEAEGLHLKLKQMFVALGSGVAELGEAVGAENEMCAMRSVNSQIEELEKEYAALSANHAAQGEFKGLSASLAKEAGAKSKAAWSGGVGAMKRRSIQVIVGAFVIICMILFIASSWNHGKAQKPVEEELKEELQPIFVANEQQIFQTFHPIGTAKSIKVLEVSVDWKDGVDTNLEKDITQFTVRFTIYWEGPVTTDGFTKANMTYDAESERWINPQVIDTNGVTKTDLETDAINFGVGFLQGVLEHQNQQNDQ